MDNFALAIEDGCYYLKEIGLDFKEIGNLFKISEEEARKRCRAFAKKLENKAVIVSPYDKKFWEEIIQESRGNEKATLVDDKGKFYHSRRADLEKADTRDLMALFEFGKEYLNTVPPMVLESLENDKPGYNPLSPIKQLKDSLGLIEEILSKRAS